MIASAERFGLTSPLSRADLRRKIRFFFRYEERRLL
jgi:hypothetical protein